MKLKEESSPSIHVVESPTADMPEPRANRGSDMTYEEQPCSHIPDIDTGELTEEQRLSQKNAFRRSRVIPENR